jgi:magnesium transporter
MLRLYTRLNDQLVAADAASLPRNVVWFDLHNPTPEEDRLVEQHLGLSLPTIEPSARLYREDGAEFMTVTLVTKLDTEDPVKTPVTFILKDATLVTVRYAEPRSFAALAARAQRTSGLPTGEMVMLGLIEFCRRHMLLRSTA